MHRTPRLKARRSEAARLDAGGMSKKQTGSLSLTVGQDCELTQGPMHRPDEIERIAS
jgi:hypothetical protein